MLTIGLRLYILLVFLAVGHQAASAAPAVALPAVLEAGARPGSFAVRGRGYAMQLDAAGMHLAAAGAATELRWLGARASASLAGEAPSATRLYDYRGTRQSRQISTYSTARARALYPGIDLLYHSRQGALEFDFELAPHADPSLIAFSLPNSHLTASGDLQLANGLLWRRPVATQHGRPVTVAFEARGAASYGFRLGAYDPAQPLVIDPILGYATYLGGGLTDEARSIAVDADLNLYVIGSTTSIDFPGTTRGQTYGAQDIFVAKINPEGTAVLWAAYIGGSGLDTGYAIAIDAAGNVYGGGSTASNNFPVSDAAPQKTLSGGSGITDGVVFKLDPTGAQLLWSTYLGGTQSDAVLALGLDPEANVYVTGRADSTNFPNTNNVAFPARGAGDAFITRINADGAALGYSLVLGGFGMDSGNGLAVHTDGSVYVVGETRSDNFPASTGAYQTSRRGASDAFVARVRPDGSGLLYATYFGGEVQESGNAIAVDANGNAYITGQTLSTALPVSFNGFQRIAALVPDAFVAKINPEGAGLLYATYLGGDSEDAGYAIAVTAQGEAVVAGRSNSANFPVRNDGPLTATAPAGNYDGFLAKFNPTGTQLTYSTMVGGTGDDAIYALAIRPGGRTWVAGTTDSNGLTSIPGVISTRLNGASDAFLARFAEITVVVTPGTLTLGAGESQQFTAAVSNTANTGVRWSLFPELGTVTPAGVYTAPASFSGSQTVTLTAYSLADSSKYGSAVITLSPRVGISVTPGTVTLQPNQSQQFTATVTGAADTSVTWSFSPASGTLSATGLYTAPGVLVAPATVTITATSNADSSRSATATVSLQPLAGPVLPEFTAAGVAHGASFGAVSPLGGVVPGEIVTIFGKAMGPATLAGLQLDANFLVARELAGTRVLFDDVPAPIVYTSAGQLACVVPFAVEGRATTSVIVEYQGRKSTAVSLPVTDASPGLFTLDSSGRGPGAILNQDGSVNSPQSPAERGSVVVLYLTGTGATTPTGVDGKPNAAPLPMPKLPVNVSIGGIDAVVEYAGGAPGLVAGVAQINVRVPRSVPAGSLSVIVSAGTRTSAANVTVSVY